MLFKLWRYSIGFYLESGLWYPEVSTDPLLKMENKGVWKLQIFFLIFILCIIIIIIIIIIIFIM